MECDSVLGQQSISGKNVSLTLCVWKPCYIRSHISFSTIFFLEIVYYKIRLYLGCFGWVINLIYSTLFSNILHAFRHNITYAQNPVCPIAMRCSRAVI